MVQIKLILLTLTLFISSCKTTKEEEAFPESKEPLAEVCEGQVIPQSYLVKLKSGLITRINAFDDTEFFEHFFYPYLDRIEYVEYEKFIEVPRLEISTNSYPINALNKNWGQMTIEAPKLWDLGITGKSIKIAVLDTLVDVYHPHLINQIAVNEKELNGLPGVDDDKNGLIDDIYGWDFYLNQAITSKSQFHTHGTHVAGIIAGNNNSDWKGVAPEAKIIPINFMSQEGFGSVGAAIKGIDYAQAQGAKIINASWGGPICSQLLRERIYQLDKHNILFVSASGNNGLDIDTQPEYPAAFNFPFQITVAATRPSDFLAGFSNTSFKKVHIAAPGEDVYSLLPNGSYGYMTGTSMATPFVSGSAALLWSKFPQASTLHIKGALLKSVDLKSYRVLSEGRLNVYKGYQLLNNN